MGSSQCHIAVLAFPFGTHAAPLLNVVERLAAAFTNARFSFFSTLESNSALFRGPKPAAGNVKAYDVWDGIADGESVHGYEATQRFVTAMPGNYQKAVAEAEEETGTRFGCFLTDAFLWFGCDMAAERGGVPWIALWTAGSCALSAHLHTDLIRSLVVSPTANGNGLEQKLKVIPGMSAISISDVPAEILAENLQAPFPGMIYNMALTLHRANAVVLNSFQQLEQTITNDLKTKLQNVFNVGPMVLHAAASPKPPIISDEYHCISWLDSLPPAGRAVYLSFGTALTLPQDEIVALAEALEAKRAPFLWSLKPHGVKLLPDGFLERTKEYGKVVSWAPQTHVLSHPAVGAFVTHCGWNSILEAISFGMCLICRPFFGDQKMNCRVVESVWEIGVKVEGGMFTKNGTIKALNLVLDSGRGKLLKENVLKLKVKALEAVEHDGSSTKDFQELLHLFNDYIC